jgi:hypothetical protein
MSLVYIPLLGVLTLGSATGPASAWSAARSRR